MKLKFILAITICFFGVAGYVMADGDQKDSMMMEQGSMMKDGAMMDDQTNAKEEVKLIEVGNKFCPVSGEKIPPPDEKGEMGEAVKYEYNGKIYNLCCPMCIKDFKKNPEKYSKIAEDEVAKEKMMEQKENQKGTTK